MNSKSNTETTTSIRSHDKYSDELRTLLGRLRPFQREAFDFATCGGILKEKTEGNGITKSDRFDSKKGIGAGRLLLADEMGLGKTVTSLAIMLAYKSEWPLLILCPASLRYTWPAEIEKFIPSLSFSEIYVVNGFDDSDFYSNPIKRSRIKVVIATYSLLQNRSAAAQVLRQFNFQCVIADESHNLKEKTSQRCQLAMPLLMNAKRLILLSGTPALARPVELWPQLHCIDQDLFGSYTSFTKTYCNARRGRFGWDVKGLSNASELHSKLKTIMIRRLKADVLSDLPSKQRSIVPVKIQGKCIRECRDLIEEMNRNKEVRMSLEGGGNDAVFEARSLLMQAYQASGIGKAQSVAEYVLDWLRGSGSQKLLVFAHHTEVLNIIESAVSKHLKGVGHIRIDGSVPPAQRAASVRKFQNSAQVRLGLLSITAAGVGLTLTAASSVIFAELHWTPGVLAQAEDRCHRIGQTNAVNVMYCVCKDKELSVDLALWGMLAKKVSCLGRMIEGQKGLRMNATETENKAPSEQELASFFASTSPNKNAMNTQGKHIIKGSIQSFFFKKSSSCSKAAPCEELFKSTTTVERSAITGPPPSSKRITWSCRLCTFSNDAKLLSSAHQLNCKMCKTPFSKKVSDNMLTQIESNVKQGSITLSHEISEKECSSQSNITWQCKSCTFINKGEKGVTSSMKCEMCNAPQGRMFSKRTSEASSTPLSSSRTIQYKKGCNEDYLWESKDGKPISQQHDIIQLDDSEGTCTPITSCGVISLADDELHCSDIRNRSPPTVSCDEKSESLTFIVSRNSGRVAIHDLSGEPSFVNFDIDDIITDATSDYLLDKKLKRTISPSHDCQSISKTRIHFIESEIEKVVSGITKMSSEENQESSIRLFCTQLKRFVLEYLSLREVEKKAIKEWEHPISCSQIKDTLKQILLPRVSPQTERYIGGCKERALKNKASGIATDLDVRVLNGTACAFCGSTLSDAALKDGVRSTYCSIECAENGRLRRGGMFASSRVRSQIFALESGVCQKCGVDANALYLRISALQPAERLNTLCNVNWNLPKSSQALRRLLQDPKESDFWQADHIIPVAEGGGDCGLENLRTLCTPCHLRETESLRSRLRLNSSIDNKSISQETDIRLLFPNCKSMKQRGSTNPRKKRRKHLGD